MPDKKILEGNPERSVHNLLMIEMVQAVDGEGTLQPGVFRLRLRLEDPESETGWSERDFICVDGDRKKEILVAMRDSGMRWEGELSVPELDKDCS